MDEFFKWLSTNNLATNILIGAFGLVVFSLVLIYLIAFFQGRSIQFWPPKIGEKPDKKKSVEKTEDADRESLSTDVSRLLICESGTKVILQKKLGEGGMARVYRGVYGDGQQVAVKMIRTQFDEDSRESKMLSNEYNMVKRLHHRNILTIMDKGVQNNHPFLVMEYIPGGSLRDYMRSTDKIPGDIILSIATQVADSIDYAHAQGVIHRDIKPENILFEAGPQGRLVISDFGLARIWGAASFNITAEAETEVAGTPAYIAPETIEGKGVSFASDIYGFGFILYEMIAGRAPFIFNNTIQEIYLAKLTGAAPDIREFRKVSARVAARLSLALTRDPEQRPASARAVLAGIEEDIRKLR